MSTSPGQRRLVSLDEAANYLGVNVLTIRRRIAAGELDAFRVGRSQKAPIRVDLAQIDNELLRPIPAAEAGK
ncbi:excisionase family DNA-binding protein [Nocardioides caeni]|uniref:Helix-turn-helix domain-containing protein n=1 Tax=Nocardioides caeni TaxID=574700 RepID=A0A4S8NAN6_9ACTN|nr:excisionase family DNA-binding protein [Nocardioides caeni]THV13370.1 helix-turn-helix domain-containing protein [Nocardioides caeni]